ncbi:MAG TPA: 50S ribosomal protein L20 [Clostridiales bacterium]|jgi:large subunit ribosomal protein L20|nr:50S ribosomal protein L20 [Clostridiales bacterium]HQP70422.1 50S ribosomal protein L20 [Clostridiales bacterium]
MPRANTRVASRNRRKKVLKAVKGYWGRRGKLLEAAYDASKRAGQYAYRDRKVKKRKFRELWIIRINAAARENGMSYSEFMHKLSVKNIELDRKVLAGMAVEDPAGFKKLVDSVR